MPFSWSSGILLEMDAEAASAVRYSRWTTPVRLSASRLAFLMTS